MYRIIGNRSTGKTKALLELAKENRATVACKNPNAMRQKAYAYGFTGIDFISYEELFNGFTGKVMIDEIEKSMKYFSDVDMVGYTLTNED